MPTDPNHHMMTRAMRPGVVIGITLDTKLAETEVLRDELDRLGLASIVIDCGVLGAPGWTGDITAAQTASLGGGDIEELRSGRDGPRSLAVMTAGLQGAIEMLLSRGLVLGYISMGGGTNAALAAAAFRSLPFGVPKMMVSTTVSGDMAPIVDSKDVVLVHSVVDILGTGSYLRDLLRRSAALMRSLVDTAKSAEPASMAVTAGVTAFGATTAAASLCFDLLSARGFDVLTFHARGSGGRAAEAFIREGRIQAMLDLTTTEVTDEIVGGIRSAGPERMDAAIEMQIPQVILPGAVDIVNFGPRSTIPARFEGRVFVEHTPHVTLMRANRDEVAEVASFMLRKLRHAQAPVTVLIPMRGFSSYDREGAPFFDPRADAAFAETMRAGRSEQLRVVEIDAHINDPSVAQTAVEMLARP